MRVSAKQQTDGESALGVSHDHSDIVLRQHSRR